MIKEINIKNFPFVKEQFDRLYTSILHKIPHDRYFIAGGFATYCLEQEFNNRVRNDGVISEKVLDSFFNPARPGDVDIYLYDEKDLHSTLVALYDFVNEAIAKGLWKEYNNYDRRKIVHNTYSFTFKYSPYYIKNVIKSFFGKEQIFLCPVPVQVIKFFYGHPADVISKFDFSCVAAAIDKKCIYCNDKTLEDIAKKRLEYNNRVERFSYNTKSHFLIRLAKYCSKDYIITDPLIVNDLLDDNFMASNKYSDLYFYNKESIEKLEKATSGSIYANIERSLQTMMFLSKFDNKEKEKYIKDILQKEIFDSRIKRMSNKIKKTFDEEINKLLQIKWGI